MTSNRTRNKLVKKGKKAQPDGELPAVCVVEISAVDRMGDLVARPQNWQDTGSPPAITIFADDKHGGNVGIHDRLLVRLTRDRERQELSYIGRIIRKLERTSTLAMGLFQIEDDTTARVQPTDKKDRNHYQIAKSDWNGARDGELVLVE
ncbi:MAG: hypothetical protein GXP02_02575, partial [Alphaproteobacteria bacterium]|nr:hypothetical protein [Alphaproteobacteria bacterium]